MTRAFALSRGLSQQGFDFRLESLITFFAFEERSAGMDVPDDPAAVEKNGYRRPASIMLVKPPVAEGFPLRIDRHGKCETQLADLLFHVADRQRPSGLMMIKADDNEPLVAVAL